MASFWYNRAKYRIMTGDLDLDSDTIKVMPVNSSYSPNPDEDDMDSAVVGEIGVDNYSSGPGGTGRKELTNKSSNLSDASDLAYLDADDITWSLLGGGAVNPDEVIVGFVIYEHLDGADDTNNIPIAYLDTINISTNGQDLVLTFSGNGVLRIA